jgi:hypothetical protein
MTDNDEDRGRSRRLDTEDREWSSTGRILSDRMIEGSGDAVCGLHHAQGDKERRFFGLASKPRSKISPSLASKLVATVLMFWRQNPSPGFPDLALNIGSCGLVIWPTKSPWLFLGLGP